MTARIELFTIQTTLLDKLTGIALNFKKPEGKYCFMFDPMKTKIVWPKNHYCSYHQHLLKLTAKVDEAEPKKKDSLPLSFNTEDFKLSDTLSQQDKEKV